MKKTPNQKKNILINCLNLSKTYQFGSEEIHALKDVNLEVIKGEFVAIMGKSGCGKTTLINTIAGLLQPTQGNVVIDGKSLKGLTTDQLSLMRRNTIGIVFQMFNLHPGLTVLENVELPLLFKGIERDKRRDTAQKVLASLEMEGFIDNYPEELSGGEKQRVAIARALTIEPKILLADEPTGNLNSLLAKEIIKLFIEINQNKGITIILVTHDESLINKDMRLIKLKDGMIMN